MRKTITADNILSTKALAGVDRGEVTWDETTGDTTILLRGLSQDDAEWGARTAARHTERKTT